MTDFGSKKPVYMVNGNEELLKAQSAGGGHVTDFGLPENLPTTLMADVYRTPSDRANGNVFFRRNPDGSLDVGYARRKVVDAILKYKDGGPLTDQEATVLSVVHPHAFSFFDSGLNADTLRVKLRISPGEAQLVAMSVAAHLEELMEYKEHKRQ